LTHGIAKTAKRTTIAKPRIRFFAIVADFAIDRVIVAG
jgi:hypothetical protein